LVIILIATLAKRRKSRKIYHHIKNDFFGKRTLIDFFAKSRSTFAFDRVFALENNRLQEWKHNIGMPRNVIDNSERQQNTIKTE
jgi:hypothetical protein